MNSRTADGLTPLKITQTITSSYAKYASKLSDLSSYLDFRLGSQSNRTSVFDSIIKQCLETSWPFDFVGETQETDNRVGGYSVEVDADHQQVAEVGWRRFRS